MSCIPGPYWETYLSPQILNVYASTGGTHLLQDDCLRDVLAICVCLCAHQEKPHRNQGMEMILAPGGSVFRNA